MDDKEKRNKRIQQKSQQKIKSMEILKSWARDDPGFWGNPRIIGLLAHTPKNCSCPVCKNSKEETRQSKKSKLDMKEQLKNMEMDK